MLVRDEAADADLTSALQEATREFADLYERHAYLVYNLALRTTCEPAAALAASERAFLAQLGKDESEDRLAADAIEAALSMARLKPRPGGAGAEPEEALLSLTAGVLDPRERALLVLAGLRGLEPAEAARPLHLAPVAAAELVDDAYAKLATAGEQSKDEARDAYAAWLWAVPPPALWEGIYPKFYRAAERRLRQAPADEQPTTKLAPVRTRPRRRLTGLRFALALALPPVVAGGALAYTQLSGGSGTPKTAAAPAALAPTSGRLSEPIDTPATVDTEADAGTEDATQATTGKKPLTARQLDQLRRNELRALQRYSWREADRRLTQAQRDYAARKVGLLRELAERRLDAARRERELARAERRTAAKERRLERERRQVVQRERDAARDRGQRDSGTPAAPQDDTTTTSPAPESDAQKQNQTTDCLYNPDNGEYICEQ
jgi:hypothetical protein